MAPEAPATSACSCPQHRLTPLVAERPTSSFSFSPAQQGVGMMEVQEVTSCSGAAGLRAAGPDWALPVLGVVLPLERQSQAAGAPNTLLWGTPASHQAGNMVWVPRIAPGSTEKGWTPAAHPATPQDPAPHGHSMEHPQLTWDLTVSCTPQGSSSRAGQELPSCSFLML